MSKLVYLRSASDVSFVSPFEQPLGDYGGGFGTGDKVQ